MHHGPQRMRRLSDYDALVNGLSRRRGASVDRRLVLFFALVAVCAGLGVIFEAMQLVGVAWGLFIAGAAFLLAAVQRLFAQVLA